MLLVLLFCLSVIYGQPVESNYRIGYTTVKEIQYPYSSNITREFNSRRTNNQPKRVVIHNSNGDSLDTHLYDDYQKEWTYYYGNITHGWYEKRSDGYYYRWNGNNWENTGLRWLVGIAATEDKNAHASVPIGEPTTLLYLLSIYSVYELFNKKKKACKLGDSKIIDYALDV